MYIYQAKVGKADVDAKMQGEGMGKGKEENRERETLMEDPGE